MSDGLVPPLNAPPAGAAVPGVQPGSTGADIAQVVIVISPSGGVSGVFVYPPGTTPGPGTPPEIAITASSTDPYGNPLPTGGTAGLIVQSPGGTGPYAELTSSDANGEPGLIFPSRRAAELLTAETNLQINNAGMANEFLINVISGPAVTPKGDFVDIGLASGAEDGSETATAFYEYNDGAGNFYEIMEVSNNGLTAPYVAQLIGQKPGATEPTSDIFHTMNPLSAGFNLTGNNFNGDPTYAEYTFEPMGPKGSVHIRVNANVTAGPGAAFKLLTGAAFPAGYRPTQPRYFPVSFNESAVIAGSNNAMGMGVLETSGNIFVYGGSGVAADSCLVFEATIRLD